MYYYQFHIGDYRASTAHLSNDEDLAYRRLIDMYYDSELPISLDVEWVARRIRMSRAVVSNVLQDMFTLSDEGWRHERCDEELAKYKRMSEGGKRGASKRWSGSSDSPPIAPLSPPVSPPNANHKPTTINQQPIKKQIAPPFGVSVSVWGDFVVLRRQKKAAITETAMKGIAREAAKACISLEDALRVCCERNWSSFKAEWVANKPLQTTAHQASTLAAARSIFGDERSLSNERTITIEQPKTLT